MFAGGLDFSSPVKKFFYDPLGTGRPCVDAVVSLTGFALVGGPARQDAPKAIEALTALNVPYLCSLPLVFQVSAILPIISPFSSRSAMLPIIYAN